MTLEKEKTLAELTPLDPNWVRRHKPITRKVYDSRKYVPGVKFAAVVESKHLDIAALAIDSDNALKACDLAVAARSQFCYVLQFFELTSSKGEE